jgi:predicted nucleic acid-binding protein
MNRIVVSDTTALTHLAKINDLHILQALYGEILIPPAVHRELTQVNPAQPGAFQVLNTPWIKVVALQDQGRAMQYRETLDPGEAEAIALAVERNADLLIIDEVAGRATAKKVVRKIIGMAGILLEAKRAGVISAVKPHLLALEQSGFRLGKEIFHATLGLAGET